MNNLYQAHLALNKLCDKAGIRRELLITRPNYRGVVTIGYNQRLQEDIGRSLHAIGAHYKAHRIDGATVHLLSTQPLAESVTRPLVGEAERRYSGWQSRLIEAFDGSTTEPQKPSAQTSPTFRATLREALNGIATPDGTVQPAEGVRRLKAMMNEPTRSGVTLTQALKKAGVTMHVPKPSMHVAIFKRQGQEVWRVETITLSDKKNVSETLSALWSIAAGKAPNARQMDLDRKKQMAQAARESESELEAIAGKYAPDEDQLPQGQAVQQPTQQPAQPTKPARPAKQRVR